MRPIGRRPIRVRRGRKMRMDACKCERGCEAKGISRGLPEAGCGLIFIDGQDVLAYAVNAAAILLAAMNANVSAGPRVPPEPG